MKHQNIHENLLYLALWGLIFITPIVSLYGRSITDPNIVFRFAVILNVWKVYAFFLLIFLIHNFVLAPLLVYRGKWKLYAGGVAVILILVALFTCADSHQPKGPRPGSDKYAERPLELREGAPGEPEIEGMTGDDRNAIKNPMGMNVKAEDREAFRKMRGERRGAPPMVGEIDLLLFIILVLMIGINLAVKYYAKGMVERKQLKELEKQNLEQQLTYLKYQINPHFFMNTLNNIHALVDIDTEQAKTTIEQLSKMMRYVLYEGDRKFVPLDKEIAFIKNYVELMRIRYTDKVDIKMQFPENTADIQIPPMLYMTFVENAFKHGVSYKQNSFIDILIAIDGNSTVFKCRNSKRENTQQSDESQQPGGVGIANASKRLDILYGDNYQLDIKDEETYEVILKTFFEKNK